MSSMKKETASAHQKEGLAQVKEGIEKDEDGRKLREMVNTKGCWKMETEERKSVQKIRGIKKCINTKGGLSF